jgi:DNA mismatch repair ATPase MutS
MQPWIEAAPWMTGLALVNLGVAAASRRAVRRELESSGRVGLEVGVLREGIALLQRQQFEGAKLGGIAEELKEGRAATVLLRVERITAALDLCAHPFFEFVCHILIMKTHLALGLARWRQRHGESLRRWLRAWAEFEALAALAGYACEHPHDTFPELAEGEVVLDGCELGHPTIPAATCVSNHVSLGVERRLYVISGSNMAGKSTLLRAIGLNAALAYAGAPVRAASLRISRFTLCASLSVVDSMIEGKSRFLAEVEKLRQMTTLAQERTPVLFLIDEILGGTNSRDRRIAAEAVVRSLVASGAMGALSTHDLALAEIAEIEDLRGANVHMGSRDGTDPLDFDYLLKPGVTRESNAIAIARMAGVPA